MAKLAFQRAWQPKGMPPRRATVAHVAPTVPAATNGPLGAPARPKSKTGEAGAVRCITTDISEYQARLGRASGKPSAKDQAQAQGWDTSFDLVEDEEQDAALRVLHFQEELDTISRKIMTAAVAAIAHCPATAKVGHRWRNGAMCPLSQFPSRTRLRSRSC
jgi:hypothetical protein